MFNTLSVSLNNKGRGGVVYAQWAVLRHNATCSTHKKKNYLPTKTIDGTQDNDLTSLTLLLLICVNLTLCKIFTCKHTQVLIFCFSQVHALLIYN